MALNELDRLVGVVTPDDEAALVTCDACGSTKDVRYRGWHDDGDPMRTCAECGGPEHDMVDDVPRSRCRRTRAT
jgi:hypothetical protein